MKSANPLAQLRNDLALAKADLREAKDNYAVAKAYAEQDAAIDGKNEAERTRRSTIAISNDHTYNRALAILRGAEHEVDRLEAAIENALDDRRAWEWSIRSALVDALGQTGKDDGPAFDEPIDDRVMHIATTFGETRRPQPADAATDTSDWFGR